jgi:hypothetical protein
MSNLKAIRAANFQETGGSETPLTQGLNWYFDNVLTPYMDKTKPLYDQISTLEGSGQSPAAVYAQIDAIKNQYTGAALSHGGETYPTPDEFFFGGGTKNQQNYQTISMTVRPISYLSDAQRKLVGYPSFTGEDDMWKAISDLKASAASKMTAAGVNSGTIAADKVNQYVDNQSARIAASYGQEGLDAYKLETALPYVRLQSTGFASSDPIMQQAFATASYINAAITKAKLSPTNTTSPIAVELKTAFYDWMQTQMQDPTFAKNMQSLSAALPLPNGVPRSGALLWEDVFFGQSNQAYISSAFLNSFTGAS